MRTKYSLEIDVSGYEGPCDEGRWLGLGTIQAEGDSLQECLDSAQYDLIDQDGGEAGFREADSEWMQDLIEKEFMKRYPPHAGTAGPERDFRAEQDAEAASLNRENGRE